MENIINFGTKYQGYPYEVVLEKDLSYCEFIHRCPSNEKTAHFKKFIEENIQAMRSKKIQNDLVKLSNRLIN